jgi:hypothetical protein
VKAYVSLLLLLCVLTLVSNYADTGLHRLLCTGSSRVNWCCSRGCPSTQATEEAERAGGGGSRCICGCKYISSSFPRLLAHFLWYVFHFRLLVISRPTKFSSKATSFLSRKPSKPSCSSSSPSRLRRPSTQSRSTLSFRPLHKLTLCASRTVSPTSRQAFSRPVQSTTEVSSPTQSSWVSYASRVLS